jgi:putative DNA primase/helicase
VQHGCTLKEYASEKRIPIEFLHGLGLSDVFYMGAPAIRIPYVGADGTELAAQFRLALRRDPDGADNRFRWRKGSKTGLYGLWKLDQACAAGYVVMVEGASDCHTLWFHDVPAIAYGKETQPSRKWLKLPLFSTVDRQPTDPGCCLFCTQHPERI